MSNFFPSERELVVNPITGGVVVGKNVDSYEENPNVVISKKMVSETDQYYNRFKYYTKDLSFDVSQYQQKQLNRLDKLNMKNDIHLAKSNQDFEYQPNNSKLSIFKTMGQYDNIASDRIPDYKKQSSSVQKLKSTSFSETKAKPDSFQAGQGGLKCEDIEGASPSKFKRGRKLFIDRNEVKSILGQSPGKYHGFANDYYKGGTYKPEDDYNSIVSDYRNITKNKLSNRFNRTNDEITDASAIQYPSNELSERANMFKRNRSVERGSIRVGMNKSYEDSAHNISTTATNYSILREKKKMLMNPKDFMNHSNQSGVGDADGMTSEQLLKLPQMKVSSTRNEVMSKTNSSNKDSLSNLSPEQYIKLRNNGYFAGETFGAATKIGGLKTSNFRGAARLHPSS